MKTGTFTAAVALFALFGWTSCTEGTGTPPLPDPWISLWTFYPRAGAAGAGMGPWSCSENVVASSGDSLWLLHGRTGTPLQKAYLPRTWTDGSYPGSASLQQGDWAYLLGYKGILVLHLPTLRWRELTWPSPTHPDETQWVEPALFAGPGSSVCVISKSTGALSAGASSGTSPETSARSNPKTGESPTNGWTSTAWVWNPDSTLEQGAWQVLWKQGWRGEFIGSADGLAQSPGTPGDAPAGWWRHRAPHSGTLMHSSGSTVALRGNPVAHPPVVLNPSQVAVLLEHKIESYRANGTQCWSVMYSDSTQLDRTLWLGWAVGTKELGSLNGAPSLWVKGSDDQLWLVRASDGWVERRWNRAGWSPSGSPKLDARGGLWYTAEGALWRAALDRLDRMVDAQCTGTPAVWNEPRGTAVAVRDGMKISAYLCR
jgi:hypothetical protein